MGTVEDGIQHIVQDDEMLCPALRPVRDATEMTTTTGPDIITILHTPTPQQTYHTTQLYPTQHHTQSWKNLSHSRCTG